MATAAPTAVTSTMTDPADEAGGEVVYASDGLVPVPVTKPPPVPNNAGAGGDGGADELILDSEEMTPQTAFEHFQGKVYSVKLPAIGVSNHQNQRTSIDETPLERLARLQQEIEEVEAHLQANVNYLSAGSGRDFDEQLVALASSLKTRLTQAQTTRALEQDDLTRLIREQLEKVAVTPDGKDASSTTTSPSTTGVVYELYGNAANPTTSTEDRIVKLERLLGSTNSTSNSSSTSTSTTHKSLVHRLEELETLVQTVDPQRLEQTATKAKVIRADLEAASKARNKLTATYKKEDSKMIQQLHQQMRDLEGLSGYLPSLVERLQQLAGLHVQASTFSSRLSELEGGTNQVGATVQQLESTFGALQSNLVENMMTMETNLKTLDERLNKL